MAGAAPPTNRTPPVVVFDCNTYLQAAVRDTGPAFACLHHAEAGNVTLVTSKVIIAEVADVLTRPTIQRKFPALTPESTAAYLKRIASFAVIHDPVPKILTLSRDPKDEPYLNLAIAARASYLVTRDKDLLDLMSIGGDARDLFGAEHRALTIIEPVSFLRLLDP